LYTSLENCPALGREGTLSCIHADTSLFQNKDEISVTTETPTHIICADENERKKEKKEKKTKT
jgi:hypothetical protein